MLDATPRGGVVTLAQRAVVRMSSTLTIPAGVTLRTTGSPTPDHYANMARLVRADSWPTYAAAVVTLRPGAKLDHVWIDGQMGDPTGRRNGSASNVRVLSGTGTAVNDNRIGNTAGATNVSSAERRRRRRRLRRQRVQPQPRRGVLKRPRQRQLGRWALDRMRGRRVTDNDIVDASDVGLIVFGLNGFTQVSQLRDSVVVNAGQGAFASLGVDQWNNYPAGRGDGPGVASRSFTGSDMSNNFTSGTPRAARTRSGSPSARPVDRRLQLERQRHRGDRQHEGDPRSLRQNRHRGLGHAQYDGDERLASRRRWWTTPPLRQSQRRRRGPGRLRLRDHQGPYLDTDYTACIG